MHFVKNFNQIEAKQKMLHKIIKELETIGENFL